MEIHEKAVNLKNFIDEFRNYYLKKSRLLNKKSAFLFFFMKYTLGEKARF